MKVIVKDFSDDLKKSLVSGSMGAVGKSAHDVFAEMDRTCPVLSGHLKSTGHVIEAKQSGKEIYAVVEYDAKYAIFAEYKRIWMRRAGIAKEKQTMQNFGDIA